MSFELLHELVVFVNGREVFFVWGALNFAVLISLACKGWDACAEVGDFMLLVRSCQLALFRIVTVSLFGAWLKLKILWLTIRIHDVSTWRHNHFLVIMSHRFLLAVLIVRRLPLLVIFPGFVQLWEVWILKLLLRLALRLFGFRQDDVVLWNGWRRLQNFRRQIVVQGCRNVALILTEGVATMWPCNSEFSWRILNCCTGDILGV